MEGIYNRREKPLAVLCGMFLPGRRRDKSAAETRRCSHDTGAAAGNVCT